MATWKNFEFKMWLKEINASCLSQEKLKLEAMKFSEKFDNVDKKTISKICDDFDKELKKVWKEAFALNSEFLPWMYLLICMV